MAGSTAYKIVIKALAEIVANANVAAETRVEAARLLRDILFSSYF